MLLAWIEIQQFLVNNSHHVIVLNRISTVFIQQFSSCHWFKKNSADYFEQFSLCHWSKKDFNCFYSTILIISSVWTEFNIFQCTILIISLARIEFQQFLFNNSHHIIGSNIISTLFVQQLASCQWFEQNFKTSYLTILIMSLIQPEFQNFLFNISRHVICLNWISTFFIQQIYSCHWFEQNFNNFIQKLHHVTG